MTLTPRPPQAPTGTLALAAVIATLSGEELRDLLRSRRVASPRAVQDPLGLAIELLRPESVQGVLKMLDRSALTALLNLGYSVAEEDIILDDPRLDDLRRLGLIGIEPRSDETKNPAVVRALPEVNKTLEHLKFESVAASASLPELTNDAGPQATDEVDTSSWFGPAVASVSRTAALLRALAHRPARLSRKGAVTVVAKRELATATHDDPERTAHLLHTLRLAGLATPFTDWNGRSLLRPSHSAAGWLGEPYPERWLALAEGLINDLSPALQRTISLGGVGGAIDLRIATGGLLDHEYPLLPEADRQGANEWASSAELLGLAVGPWLTAAAIELLNGRSQAARDAAVRDFPPAASGVYLQPDLSLIVPGPLAPGDEAALNEIASTEQLEVATTMRLSPATLTRALRAGTEISEIRALLERLSLTGIPQPLDYLLGDLDRKQQAGHLHESPQRPWVDRSAHTADAIPSITETDAAQHGATAKALSADLEELAKRVEKAAHSSSGAGDLTRRLELAIRHRSTVKVTATARNQERTFTMLPVSLAGGRLRATDETAGVERTLPLTSIVAVEAL